jgi:hypothetical protein
MESPTHCRQDAIASAPHGNVSSVDINAIKRILAAIPTSPSSSANVFDTQGRRKPVNPKKVTTVWGHQNNPNITPLHFKPVSGVTVALS